MPIQFTAKIAPAGHVVVVLNGVEMDLNGNDVGVIAGIMLGLARDSTVAALKNGDAFNQAEERPRLHILPTQYGLGASERPGLLAALFDFGVAKIGLDMSPTEMRELGAAMMAASAEGPAH